MRLFIIIFVIAILFPITSGLAKTPQLAILGNLIPAVIKCFGKWIVGVNMNKVIHIIDKVQHGLNTLDPAEIVYEVVQVVATAMPSTKIVQVTLISGKVIHLFVKIGLGGGAVGLGTGYVVERLAEEIERVC